MLRRLALAFSLVLSAALGPLAPLGAQPAAALSTGIVISQVYPGGGSSSAGTTYTKDYVELHNLGATAVDINGWSLQYGSSTGQFASVGTNLFAFTTTTTIQPGAYLLVALGSAGSAGSAVPSPDFTTTNLSMGAAAGKVALATITTTLGCGATATPCALPHANIVDLVAWGTSNNAETTAVAALSGTTGAVRDLAGCAETDDNSGDFTVVTNPVPRNSGSTVVLCTTPDLEVYKAGPALGTLGHLITYTLNISNTAAGLAAGGLLTDTLDGGATLVTYTTSLSYTFTQLSDTLWQWDLGDLPGPTANAVITVQASLPVTLTPGALVTNTLFASTTITETDLADNSASVTTTVVAPSPQLFVEKSAPAYAIAGAPFTYTLVYGNTGEAAAANVLLTDTLPAGFGVGSILSDTSGLSASDGVDTRAWTVGTLAPGDRYTFTLAVNVPATVTAGLSFTNTATISTDTAGDEAGDNTSQAAAQGYQQVTIAAIQTVANPSVDDASPLVGQTVWVEGLVTAERGDIETGNRAMVIEQPGGGPWSGLYLFRQPGLPASPAAPEGAQVRVLGVVSEFNGLTELNLSNTYSVEVLSLGNAVPGPDLLATSAYIDADTAEQWESVFIRFENAGVVNPNIGNGEWTFDDGSGTTTADDLGDVDGDLAYVALGSDFYTSIQGIGYYSFGAYKLEPRSDNDINLLVTVPSIVKTAPVLVAPGSLFTYTLSITNQLGITLTDVVITDVVPLGTTFAYANDGGVLAGDTVSWTVASLAHGSGVSVSFAVTATNENTTVVNSQYAVRAGNYLTPGVGSAYRTVVGTELRIHDIQGAGHRSQFAGQAVTGLVGVVTAVDGGGYYLQDPNPDADEATSEAIFVDTVGASGRSVGDLVVISGTVAESYPDGASSSGLSVTQLDPPFTFVVNATGEPLPDPVVIGSGGRTPPNSVIEDDANGNVETAGVFDPANDGLDFWESLEGMRVQVNNAIVVAGTRAVGELTVVPDAGAVGGLISPRGTIVLREDDGNPERIILDDGLLAPPTVNAGAVYTQPIIGVIDYTFGNFKLQATTLPAVDPGPLVSETTALTPTAGQLTIATFNVENLDPNDGAAKFATLADRIVNHLLSPDIIAVEEMQDNNGATNNGNVDASTTFATLIAAIQTAGGPTYQYRQIDPVNNQDGGETGGNIRVGFLFRTDRGVSFIDRPGATSTTANSVVLGSDGPQLAYSPGRINPTSPAFNSSRKPLAAEFLFNGAKLFVIANHWNSKGGDDYQNGRYQPPFLTSEIQRLQQATEVYNFVTSLLALDPNANIVALGDLNDFQWSAPLATVTAGGVLTPLINTLPENERYSYIFDGNAQVLDHILVSANVYERAFVEFDVVHVNSEFADVNRASDHDPSLVLLSPTPGNLSGSSKTVNSTTVTAGDRLTYTLTISNSGGSAVQFALTDTLNADLMLISAPGLSGTATLTGTALLAPGGTQVYTVTVQTGGAFSGTITNTAYLTGSGSYTLTAPAVTVTTPPAGGAPNLSGSSKTASSLSVAAGDLLTYTLTISNSGSASASYLLTDTLDANVTLVSAPGLTGTTTLTGGGVLAAGAQQTYVVTVRVSRTHSGPLNNSASLSGDGQSRTLPAPTVQVLARYWLYLPLTASETEAP